MKNEKLMLSDLLSWQDVINFSMTDYAFGSKFLEKTFSKRGQIDILNNYIRNFIGNKIREKFPDFPFDDECFNYYFYIKKDDEGKNNLYLNFSDFFMDLFSSCVNYNLDRNKVIHLLTMNNPTLKEDVIRKLKSYKARINEEISKCEENKTIVGYCYDYNIKITKDQLKEVLFAKRKMIVWVIRNYDALYEFIQSPLDLEVFKLLNKDKFMLIMAAMSLEKSGVLNDEIKDSIQENFQVIHNYLLLVDYLNSVNNQKYSVSFSSNLKNGSSLLITNDTVLYEYNKFYSRNKELIDSYHYASSYEEILQSKAFETWKRLQNERLVKSIQVNWEMIPTGEKLSFEKYKKGSGSRIVSDSDKKQAELKKAYDLVEEKMNYFYHSDPIVNLRGINTFEGYEAYMYSNGVVVFEKFYKPKTVRTVNEVGEKKKEVIMVPVDGEAIYVMNFRNFADYSKYSKPVLIEESLHNDGIKRIVHTQNGSWKDRVDKVIHGVGYGELDLEQVDEIAKQLAKRV